MLSALQVAAVLATEATVQSDLAEATVVQNLQSNMVGTSVPVPAPVPDEVALDEEIEEEFDEEPPETAASEDTGDAKMAEAAMDEDMGMPCYYDPYGNYNCGPTPVDYDYYGSSYTKDDVHTMVWTSLYQAAMPAMIFYQIERKAYTQKFGKAKENSWY